MCGQGFLRDYFVLVGGGQGWQETFDQEGINAVITRNADGLDQQLRALPAWEQLYRDNNSSLYIRLPVDEPPSCIGE